MDSLIKGDKVPESVQSLISQKDFSSLEKAVETLSSNESNIIITKKVLDSILENMAKVSNNDVLSFASNLLKIISNRSYLEVQVAKLKEVLAEVNAAKNNFYDAARILTEINFESQNLKYTDHQKLQNYIKICEYFFEADDSVSAESYIRKSAILAEKVEDRELNLRFEVCFAKSLDSSRKFLQAASKYHWLSLQQGIDEGNLLYLLDCSIVCAILAAAGPQRSRILYELYKDERTKRSKHFDIFYKMYLDRIISAKEKETFSNALESHQKAKIDHDFTVLDKAIIEHNIVAISKLYEAISFDSLSKMLDITASHSKCEKIIQDMISEKRLMAVIDQVDSIVDFSKDLDDYNNWTEGINRFCTGLDKLIAKLGH